MFQFCIMKLLVNVVYEWPLRPAMIETYDTLLSNTKHVVFAPTCYDHGIQTKETFQTVDVEGITAEMQLTTFIESNGEIRLDQKSICEQVNCQPSCPKINFGPDTLC